MLHAMDGLANAPDDDHLWELAEQLAQGDIVSCRTLMSTLGCPAPEIVWSPLAGQLRAEPLWKTLEWWQALPRRKLLPDPGQINPFDLKESLASTTAFYHAYPALPRSRQRVAPAYSSLCFRRPG